jgi:hypothetical protein
MNQFKGTQGKLSVEEIKEDNYIHLVNVKGNSVCSISTNEEQYDEALIYATLFSKAPEMLDFINRISGEMLRNDFVLDEKWHEQAKQIIKKATKI